MARSVKPFSQRLLPYVPPPDHPGETMHPRRSRRRRSTAVLTTIVLSAIATVSAVAACSMERRPGAAYAFNEPLLETLLARPPWNFGPVIVAQLFLLPGRHAGPGGDVEAICRRARQKASALRTRRTRLLGGHPALIEILADRFNAVYWRAEASKVE